MILQDGYFDKHCEKCDKQYINVKVKWCRLCQTSGNKQIDDFIQEKQSNISNLYYDLVFEWIPYNQFENIKNMNNKNSAVWKDGPLYYNNYKMKLIRKSNNKVVLKYISQDINELLNKVY